MDVKQSHINKEEIREADKGIIIQHHSKEVRASVRELCKGTVRHGQGWYVKLKAVF